MKKLVLIFFILSSLISISFAKMGQIEWIQNYTDCKEQNDTTACQALIDNGLPSVKQCDTESCKATALIYKNAGYIQEGIKYLQKLADSGDYVALANIVAWYYEDGNEAEAVKYAEIACKRNIKDERMYKDYKGLSCYFLGGAYASGRGGTRQDFFKASQNFKISCNLGFAQGCLALGKLYYIGNGVRQSHSTAKEYFGKACDLGLQDGCNLYKLANEAGM